MLGAAAGDILGQAFGGDGYNRFRRSVRDQYKWATRYEPGLIAARLRGTVRGAKEAGIHPLLAMGANASGSPVMMGQPQSQNRGQRIGGAVSRAFERNAEFRMQHDLIRAQAELSRARSLEQALSNDTEEPAHEIVTAQSEAADPNDPTSVAKRPDGKGEPVWREVEWIKGWPKVEIQGKELSENFENPVMALAFWKRNYKRLTLPMLRELHRSIPFGALQLTIMKRIYELTKGNVKTYKLRPTDKYEWDQISG